ncbi:O-antigen ligase family protein [Vibrio sp. SCSIO 43137]|uniref:O-antigen ligase family protein n=1 Tax=Vibrio sp. SCSIO 43137 TaxID=3021011 RepID=UPI002307626D|nr:O-antigen ligase family protein [Vibrio sp. SCSIO 43137]WCE31970.1 O-antigen ligase family protein [Vibrio sp. SCSIO 43137]
MKIEQASISANQQNRSYSDLILCLLVCAVISLIWYLAPTPYTAVALCLLPLALLVVISQMFWLVLLFVTFSFFRIHEVIPQLYSLKIPLLLSAGALFALLWHIFISAKLKPYWHPSLSWLAGFWLLVIMGVVLASNRPIALEQFKNIYWKIIVMTLAITWVVSREQHLSLISRLMTAAGLIVGCTALYNSANGIGMVEGTRVTIGRDLGSMLGDPNDLALVLMFPLAFSLSITLTKGHSVLFRTIAAITSLVLFMAVIATQSRGGLLGVLSVGGIFTFKHIRSKALIMTLGAIAAAVLYAVAGISDRASGGAAEDGVDASAMGRLYAWQAAFRMAVDNPFSGVGLNNFYFNYYYYSSHWDGLNHAVHSTWFGVLAETGFLGLAVFVGFIASLIITARRTIALTARMAQCSHHITTIAYAVYAGLVGTVVSGTFLTQGFNWPIYILAALTISVAQIASQNAKHN